MCDEDDSNESPSKYQKAEKIIMEKSSILQELDDLRELDVEVSPLSPSPLPNIEDMELVENDTMTEDGQGEFQVYESKNSKNKRLQKERRQLELEAEAVEQDLLRQLPGNQQEDVLRLLTGTRLESLEKVSVNSPKATLEKSTIIPIVAEGIEAKALSDIMDQAGIQVEDKRNTRRGHLLVFPKRQINCPKKLPVGQVREPKQRVNYKEQDKRTSFMVGIPLHVENTTIEQDIKKQHNINLKATRMINSKTQMSTGKFKLTLERESDMNNIGNRLLGYTIKSYRRKTQVKQCYRCQRFGHIAFDCKNKHQKCGRCGGETHQKRDCTASVPKRANCFGPHASSDRSCPKFQEIIKMLDQRQDRQVSRAHQVLNKTHQIRGKCTQHHKQPQGHQRLTQQKTNEVRINIKLSFSRHDITGLPIAVAATILRLKCAEAEADKNEVQIKGMDIARITTESINWALRSDDSFAQRRYVLIHPKT